MMTVKILEIRDSATFIPMMAVGMVNGECDPGGTPKFQEGYLLGRAGYAWGERYIWLTGINGGTERGTSSPYDWGDRTRQTAHDYIIKNWDTLKSGDVVDVEFILGITQEPKKSERFET